MSYERVFIVVAPCVANIHESLRNVYPLVHPHKLPKTKLNPREVELIEKQYLARAHPKNNTNRKSGYAHFRYKKRVDDDDDESLDSESSYGEDSDDSDDGESAD